MPSQDRGAARPGQPVVRRPVLIAGAVFVFAATWIFRWLTIDFANDHFVHLSRGRQILLGEWPVRDFFDPGLPLHYFASSAALMVFGQTLLGEAILTVTLTALGAALTFILSARASRSIIAASVVTLTAAVMFPRLYNYPKVFLYPLALVTIWHYAAHRTTTSLLMLAGVTGIAALFRLDHGVYIGLSAAVSVVLANTDRVRALPRELFRFGAMSAVFMVPIVLYIQMTAGLLPYFTDLQAQRNSATTTRFLWLPFTVDRSQPWLVIDPPAPPRVFVRWHGGVDADVRSERERRYGLMDGTADGGYVLTDDSARTLQALVNDPLVADTHNIDRVTFRPILVQSWLQRARNRFFLLRMHIAPGAVTPANVLAWLYYVTVLIPVAALLHLFVQWRRGLVNQFDVATIGTTIVMCIVIHQTLIRESPDSRLPDVAGPTMVLAAWMTAAAVRSRRRAVAAGAAIVLWSVTLWGAGIYGNLGERVITSGLLAGPTVTRDRMRDVGRLVTLRPIDFYAPVGSTGVRALTRYVLECTRPSDRLLIGSFEPQIFFYSERAFAGGQVYLKSGWHSSRTDQLMTVERVKRQRVPLVILSTDTEPAFQQDFPLVYRYVANNYREVARSRFEGNREFAVFAAQHIQPRSTYARFELPCYR